MRCAGAIRSKWLCKRQVTSRPCFCSRSISCFHAGTTPRNMMADRKMLALKKGPRPITRMSMNLLTLGPPRIGARKSVKPAYSGIPQGRRHRTDDEDQVDSSLLGSSSIQSRISVLLVMVQQKIPAYHPARITDPPQNLGLCYNLSQMPTKIC